jgi:hypothetical protein
VAELYVKLASGEAGQQIAESLTRFTPEAGLVEHVISAIIPLTFVKVYLE